MFQSALDLLLGTIICISTAIEYILCLVWFVIYPTKGPLEAPYFKGRPQVALHIYTLGKTLALLDKRHYRASTFLDDIRANLRNVAVPGTGVPLFIFFYSYWTALFFVAVVYPALSFFAAAYQTSVQGRKSPAPLFEEYLLAPSHWFAIWRANSLLAAFHALSTGSDSYEMEDKGAFLQAGAQAGLRVSPFMRPAGSLVMKHKSIEGGMGIKFYKSFTDGGDWIMQNAPAIAALLPEGAPLSTLRVLTSSTKWLDVQERDGIPPLREDLTGDTEGIDVLTVVFRAGRKGAKTDHNSVCFSVNPVTGEIGVGISNMHWYKLGVRHVLRLGDEAAAEAFTEHPDDDIAVTGQYIPDMQQIVELCKHAHATLIPDVPLCGWDVAVTESHGPVLLEANLSCNLFNGDYDREEYLNFMVRWFTALEALEQAKVAAA